MKRRILITGGAGYVGRALTRALYDEHDICVVDLLKFGLDRFKSSELSKFRLKKVDIREETAIKAAIEDFQPDTIVHLAAIHFIPHCEQDPTAAADTNILGTINLLSACPPECRFVFASSGAVYRPSRDLHDERLSEVGPRDLYGFTKLHGEHYVRYLAAQRHIPTVIVRLFNVVGPGETNPHLLPEIIAQMKSGRQSVQLGNLWPKRDYIHVLDAASGFAAAALTGSVSADETVTVNLGTSQQHSVEEIIERLREISKRPFKVVKDEDRVRAVDRPFLGASIGEMKRRFGWSPKRNIDDALKDLWRDPDLSAELLTKYGQLPSTAPLQCA